MKIIYKIPKYLALIVAFIAGYIVIRDIKTAKNATFFDLVELNNNTGTNDITILGIDAYIFIMMVGLLVTVVLAILRRNLIGIKAISATLIAIVFFLQAYLGAKILSGLELIITNKSLAFFSMEGQSLYGTVFISFIFIPVLSKLIKQDTKALFDYIAPYWIILLAFVRTGCFVIGCCGADVCQIGGIGFIPPVQLFEVICDLIIMQTIFCFENKENEKIKQYIKTGDLFFIMIGLYSLCRFLLEFIRETDVILLGFTFGQLYALICLIISIWVIQKNRRG